MSELDNYKSEMSSHITAEKKTLEEFFASQATEFFSKLTEKFNVFITDFRNKVTVEIERNAAEISSLRERCNQKDVYIDNLEKELLRQKRGNMEQGVHDRKRDVMIADIPESNGESPGVLEEKIRDDFVGKLGIPRVEVNKFVFTARHRLQKPKNGNKAPKVIAVLLDLDHANMVFTAARKKGRDGQHIQKHLPKELQDFKNRCLKIRREMIDGGVDKKDVRVWDFKGFAKLQVKEDGVFEDKLVYKMSLDSTVNFPDAE